MRRLAVIACALGALVTLSAAGPAAAAAVVRRPLPADEYGARALCAPPSPGRVACLSLELVPQTAAARARATPLGVTLHHSVEPHSAAGGTYGLRPQDLHGAYGLPTAAPAPQTIAIVDAYDDPTAEADLAAYDAEFGLPACTHANGCFTKVNQNGSESSLPAYDAGWAGEIALDLEAAHAVCQTNCRILLVEAENAFTFNLEAAVETAVAMGATEVSNSYGGPEPSVEGAAYDHPGVAITASTGDEGYLNWSSSKLGFPGHPNYPASSPDVVAVGGTRLSLTGGARSAERVWNDGSTLGTGHGAGGSGCSEHPLAPEWQQEVAGWAQVGCGSKRAAADVAADADPYSGIAVYRGGSWSTVGGTSLSSPIIAATYALAGGTGGVDYPARSLYSHLGSAALFDVTEGSNGECAKAFDEVDGTAGCSTEEEEEDCAKQRICRAAAGYDGPTGVGTPEGLAAFAPPAPVVNGVSPPEGDLGTTVTISGEYLGNVASVKFGNAAATGVVEDSPTELTATVPGHAAGEVDVTVTTGGGTSATSSADRFTYLEGTLEQTPVSTSLPTISGTPTKGRPLTEAHGGWENGPTGYAYQWLRCDSGGAGCAAVSGATAQSYELTAADVGHTIRVEETASNGAGQASAESAPTAIVANKPRQPFTWTGATARSVGVSADEWSTAGNWEGGSGPSDSLDLETATFPSLAGNANCGSSPVDACYQSHNDIDGVEVGKLSVDDRLPYIFYGQPLTLGAGGIEALSSGSENNVPVPSFRMPITLSADQTWSVEGPGYLNPGFGGIEFERSIDGEGHSLHVDMSGEGGFALVGSVDDELGPLTFEGADPGKSGSEALKNGLLGLALHPSTEAQQLNATEGNPVRLDHVAAIGSGALGPLTVTGGELQVGSGLDSIAGGIEVNGPLSVDSASDVYFDFREGASPGVDYSQLTATGDVDLGGATLWLLPNSHPCPSLPAGRQLTLVHADGQLEGNFGNAPEGILIAPCPAEQTPILTTSYTEHAAIATSLGAIPYAAAGPTIWGVAEDEQTLTAYRAPWINSPTSYEEQWLRCDGAGEACNPIPGATGQTYTLAPEDAGHAIRVRETAHNAEGQYSNTSAPTAAVVLPVPFNTAPPSVSGSAAEGQTLTASDGSWKHSPTSYAYQWLRCDSGGSGCAAISDATARTYTLADADDGHRLKVEVTAHNAAGGGSATSSPTGTIVSGPPLNTGLPTISGSGQQGQALAADPGTWEHSPTSYTYQWLRCDSGGASCAAISGAFISQYTPGSSDVGHELKVEVTAHNGGGEGSALSAATAPIESTAPLNTVLPTISGSAIEGQLLSATPGTWTNAPIGYGYKWLRCDAAGAACSPLLNNASIDYPLPEDVGHTLRVEVTAFNGSGQGTAVSDPTPVVVPPAPTVASAPTISGSAVEGQTLSAAHGVWAHNPISYDYKWLRCDSGGASCVAISSATDQTYALVAEDVGHKLKVEVTAHNAGGEGSATSSLTVAVQPHAPVNTALPAISGSAVEGQALSATDGAWEHSPTSYTYQWLRCDSEGASCFQIVGATTQTYVATISDVGHELKVEVTAHNGGGQATATSNPTAAVSPPTPVNTFPPAIAGAGEEGESLTADPGTWEHSPTSYDYQWLRCDSAGNGCAAISGATAQSYPLSAGDVGHTLRVEVTAHNSTAAATASSAPSAVVVAAPPSEPEPEESEPESEEGEPSSPSEPVNPSTSSGSPSAPGSSSSGGSAPARHSTGMAVADAAASVSGGKASIELRCNGSGACKGTLVLEPAGGGTRHSERHGVHHERSSPIGRAPFSIPAGGKATVAVHLDGAGMTLLRKAGKKGLAVSLTGVGVAPRTLKLLGAARAGRRGKR